MFNCDGGVGFAAKGAVFSTVSFGAAGADDTTFLDSSFFRLLDDTIFLGASFLGAAFLATAFLAITLVVFFALADGLAFALAATFFLAALAGDFFVVLAMIQFLFF